MRNSEQPKTLRAVVPALIILFVASASFLLLRRNEKATTEAPPPARENAQPPTPRPVPPATAPKAIGLAAAQLLPPRHAPLDDLPAAKKRFPERIKAAAGFRSIVPINGALVTGGWRLLDGRRYIATASPRLAANGQIEVAAHFLALPAERLAAPGWASILDDSARALRLGGGFFDADELMDFLRQVEATPGAETLTAPRLLMPFDTPANITIAGETNGLMLAVIVRATDDPQHVELAVTTAEM